MNDLRSAVIGTGATGAVVAAALLRADPQTMIVVRSPVRRLALEQDGIRITGQLTFDVPVKNVFDSVARMAPNPPDVIFICTKTFHLHSVLDSLKPIVRPQTKIVSAHNGLGTEDLIAETFGHETALRMSLNFGAALKGATESDVTFFNRPNFLGALLPDNRALGERLAAQLSSGGLDTDFVEDIKLHVWKKMVMKCTMASICAVTDKTIKEALEFPPTREIADACFREVIAVAKAKGYDLGPDYLTQIMAYLEKVGLHKDSMCVDIANKTQTEIDFLGGKVVEYGKQTGVPTPCYATMANLVRTIEHDYLR
ncbi:MAG: ketopantoate reductase family protein [Syntrophobacteraceae bacterium]